jgi:6-phosphogluconolactonase
MNTTSTIAACLLATSLAFAAPSRAATYVYVSNAEDGDISTYRLLDSGALQPGPRVKTAVLTMPMAVSPDRRFLYAAVRAKPYTVHVFSIDPSTGGLTPLMTAPLPESCVYISLDKTGRYLLCASYGAHVISVNAVGADGRVAAQPLQVIPVGRHPHSIRVDESNKHVYVPTLGSDQIFQFDFDARTGRLTSSTPSVFLMKAMTGPRHFITSSDGKFLYALSELQGAITTFAIDGSGLLSEASSASGMPPGTTMQPGMPRAPITGPNAPPPRNADNDIWAADIRMTPSGKFIYFTERTASTLGTLGVDSATGKLAYLATTPTEKQPRGIAIDPKGRYLVASGEKSETISVYAIDPASGALKLLDKYPTGKGANWVEIASFD